MSEYIEEKISLKRNYIFNLVKNLSMVLLPMISFPYLSRVLQPDGIGKINFASSFVQYFVMLSALGIPLYGTREIAKVRNDKAKLNQTFNELFQLNLISTIISYSIFFFVILNSRNTSLELKLFLITSLSIFSTTFGLGWFYQGLEKYAYLAKISVFFRIITVICIFIFVKDKADYKISALITTVGLATASSISFIYAKQFVSIKIFSRYSLKRHIKPILIVFSMSVAGSIYLNLDTVMLGYLSSNEAVGYYTASIKFNKIIVTTITSLGVILIPRLSYYKEHNQISEYRNILKKNLEYTYFISIPTVIGLLIYTPQILLLFSGSAFLPAVQSMRIISVVVFLISMSHFTGMQALYSMGKEYIVLISFIAGAISNFTLNLILIPIHQHVGAAIGTVVAEFLVLATQLVLGSKFIKVNLFSVELVKVLISSVIMGLILNYLHNRFSSEGIYLLLFIGVGICVFFILMFILKSSMTKYLFEFVKNRINKNV